jgi:hypothetical protein
MPKTMFPGRKINSYKNKYYETQVTFDQIYNVPKIKNIEKPNYQGALNGDKVDQMIQEYNTNPLLLKCKNKITIGVFSGIFYIIDGQHRIEMVNKLYELNNKVEDTLIFCWFIFDNDKEMRSLFNSLNKDSTKNRFYIQQNDIIQIKINDFVNLLQDRLKGYFSKRKTNMGKIKTIEEFRDELIKIKFFNNDNTSEELYQLIKNKNDEFYEINRYKIDIEQNTEKFYKDEQKHIKEKIILSLKKNNFVKWLNKPEENEPVHINKKGKKRISRNLKLKCWDNIFNTIDAECPIKNCSIKINKNETNWHAGHIISEYNGGATDIKNLRPICTKCNISMGSQNWSDYEV